MSKLAINETVIWAQLHQHQRATRHLHMRDLFADNPQRFAQMHEQLDGFLLDYSKNRITEETLNLLVELAETAELPQWMRRMCCGEKINDSESRAVLHTALRLPASATLEVDGENIVPQVQHELNRALDFAENIRSGSLKTSRGEIFTDVVNLGIGGSDLGPQTLTQALRPYHAPQLNVHFVANVDGTDLAQVLEKINLVTTLFIISSKSFTTPETLLNAHAVRERLCAQLPEEAVAQHFAAVSNNLDAAAAFGIPRERVFTVFEWVGGRYSATSAIGLPLMCAIGAERFRELLAGAHAMDEHFFHAPLRHNMPVLLALIGIWYNTFYRAHSHAVIPYHHGLRRFPAHIQQLDMESNGKQTSRHGDYLDFDTGPIIWGEAGVNCQHAFFQLLHQGSRLIPSDFIVVVNGDYDNDVHQKTLVANALAQTRALMAGKSEAQVYRELADLPAMRRDELMPQKHFPGNQPSNTIMLERLTPYYLGMLLALYEHKVFVQGVIWGINSFDQWGVEYGKVLARDIAPKLDSTDSTAYDASTDGLIRFFRQHHEHA
ncbi:MAG: glucose-6-phosphate isomerase [Neisseria sp.]|nr:glucose-6-phosphate isomerase [Neisseria sp.]